MLRKVLILFIPLLLVFAANFSQGWITKKSVIYKQAALVEKADSLYFNKNYQGALAGYNSILNGNETFDNPVIIFKAAYAAYQSSNFELSSTLFNKLINEHQFLPEFSGYFYIKSLWPVDSLKALNTARQYVKQNKGHALADSLLIPIAEQSMLEKKYAQARRYFLLAKKRKINKSRNSEFLIKAAQALYAEKKVTLAKQEFYQIIKKYPGKRGTLELLNGLENKHPGFFETNFFSVVDVYIRNRHFQKARLLLEKYIKKERDPLKKEKARYNLVKLYYGEGKYKTALYGFKNLLQNLQNKNLEPHIRLYFARIYNRRGLKQQAIDAYLDYADRFPRRRLAAETVWKAAWIYEEMNMPDKALELYRDLRKRWKKSKYTKEAYFREGFTHFRLGRIEEAEQVFTDIRFNNWPDLHVNRAKYWCALCRDIKRDSITAKRLRLDLAEEMWDDYYTLKSYLIHKSYIDSTQDIAKSFRNSSQELNYYAGGMANLMSRFEDAFQVQDLLGKKYGLLALAEIKLHAKTKDEWIALAEIYKRFGAYGRAFRTYDHINRKFYGDISFNEKPFILKERFPFYFDSPVEKYSQRYGIEKELILAVIKQESAFKSNAHSWANAYGLMQLIPATASDMARLSRSKLGEPEQLFNPEFNIHLGSLYLKQLFRRFKGQKGFMLAAYNAGPHRVKRWKKMQGSNQADVFIENIEYKETRNYVRKVLKNYWAYKLLNNNFQIDDEPVILSYTVK